MSRVPTHSREHGGGPPGPPPAPPIRDIRASLLAQRRLRGRRFCDAYTDAADAWVSGLFHRALAEGGRSDSTGVALIAVGGYGRRELCPASDLDLILVHDNVRGINRVADALWYPIWDSGIAMDHSVRTPRETLAVVKGDLKDALGVLNARRIAGDADVARLAIETARRAWRSSAEVSLRRLRAALHERWAQHGELAFLLEPDVKLARGGLRDLDGLHAMTLAAPVLEPFVGDARLDEAADTLLAVRVALHATTERRSDRLLLDDQDAVARRLGHADADELLPEVAAAARRIAWATDQAWQRFDVTAARARREGESERIEPGISVRDDELVIDDDVATAADPALALRIAAASARTGIPIAAEALARLEADATAPAEPWPASARQALVDLLGYGHAAVALMETLDHVGVLGRYVAEWPAVRSKPQRNVYHRFTVDRHLFETAAEACRLTRSVHRPDLLLTGAWLHDIGKGFPGDHSEAGATLVRALAQRMGFADDDADVLAFLVADHLLLADTAMRRDLSDPATTEMVAERVRTIDRLELLAALTEADSIATGPAAWSPWKATLIQELVARVRGFLSGEPHEDTTLAATAEQRELMALGRVVLVGDGTRLTVVAPDREGLLATVSGVLAGDGLSVRAATGISEDGMAVEVFDLDPSLRGEPDWARLETELTHALDDPGIVARKLARRAGGHRRRTAAAKPAAPRVIVDNDATPRATIIEVRAPDAIGVLARIGGALAATGCDVGVVRALTLGHEVVDTFYVTAGTPRAKITDPRQLTAVERAILEALTSPDP